MIFLTLTLHTTYQYMRKAAEKDDPIQLPQCLMLMVLFNDLQKCFFQTQMFISDYKTGSDLLIQYQLTSNFRFTVLALEMVFMIIPLRHNLATHNLEI